MTEVFDAEKVHEYEHETWNRCANEYLDGFAGLTQETVPLLIDAAKISEGKKVLEIGSGPGHVANALAQTGAEITGIDFVKSMVEIGRQKFPHITFEQANAEQLPFEENTFDAVVSNFVVHHLARPEIVFREICRVLKPGGHFAFVVFADPEAQSSIGAFFSAVEKYLPLEELPHGPLFGVTDLELYKAMLRAGGLNNFKFEFRKIIWRTETPEPIINSFWDWGNMKAVPQDLQNKIEVTTRKNLKLYQQDDGDYAFPHQALLGSAEKPKSPSL